MRLRLLAPYELNRTLEKTIGWMANFNEKKIYRRQFLIGSLTLGAFGIGIAINRFFFIDNLKQVSSPKVLIEQDENIKPQEKLLLSEIVTSPLQIRPYDRLIKYYGKHKQYNKIYELLEDSLKRVTQIEIEGWQSKRRITAIRLLRERIARVNKIRAIKLKP